MGGGGEAARSGDVHALRHTFTSQLVMAGVDLLTVRDLGGWGAQGRLAMVERYAHVAAGHTREAMDALARGERLERTRLRTVAPRVVPTRKRRSEP
jgi:hypothetical protein